MLKLIIIARVTRMRPREAEGLRGVEARGGDLLAVRVVSNLGILLDRFVVVWLLVLTIFLTGESTETEHLLGLIFNLNNFLILLFREVFDSLDYLVGAEVLLLLLLLYFLHQFVALLK